MSKILTVSIAAFNVEKFLNKTLDSLICNDLMDSIEVLIINDGSKDGTVSIARRYVEKYPQTFRLIDKENGGHGSTINKAIEIANGKYLCLLDGDDWVDTEQFSSFVRELSDIDVDLIVNSFNTVDDKTGVKTQHVFRNIEYRKIYSFDTLPKTDTMGLSAITYKTKILKENNIRVDEKCFYVDMEFISYPIPCIESIVFLPLTVYQYRVNQGTQSVSRKSLLAHIDDHTRVTKKLLSFCGEYSKKSEAKDSKKAYLQYIIKNMVSNQYSVILLQRISKESKECFSDFDMFLKNQSVDIYNALNKKFWIRIARTKLFSLYLLASLLIRYKIR